MKKEAEIHAFPCGKLAVSRGQNNTSGSLVLSLGAKKHTLQGTNISQLGKRKIIFKHTLGGDMLIPLRVYTVIQLQRTVILVAILFTKENGGK